MSNKRTPLLAVGYLLFGLPACVTVSSFLALFMARKVSNFEGTSGYAWLQYMTYLVPVSYLVLVCALPFVTRKPDVLKGFVITLGILALLAFPTISSM